MPQLSHSYPAPWHLSVIDVVEPIYSKTPFRVHKLFHVYKPLELVSVCSSEPGAHKSKKKGGKGSRLRRLLVHQLLLTESSSTW